MMSAHSARYNLSFKSVRTHFTTPTRSSVLERLPFAWENQFFRCEFKWYGSFRWILFGKRVLLFPPFIRNFRKFNSVPIVNNLKNICEKKCKISGNFGSIRSISLERNSANPFVQKFPRDIAFKWQAIFVTWQPCQNVCRRQSLISNLHNISVVSGILS